ncbi:MAG: helix-turn-helix domain-containing protein [Rhodocyclaceae bacterium]|nr:helix-turn-helix domain-containing protein [Rhodocyclaceae bacterium]
MATKVPKKASREDWHPADIIAALHKNGITLRELARKHGLSSSTTLSKALTQSYPANERRIAAAAGVPVHVMFAGRYFPDGTPMPRGIRGARKLQSTGSRKSCNGNDGQAL